MKHFNQIDKKIEGKCPTEESIYRELKKVKLEELDVLANINS